MEPATRRQLFGITCLGAVALVATLLFSPGRVVTELEGLAARPLLFVGAVTLLYLVRPFLLWPTTAVSLVLGYVYGPTVAVPLAGVGVGLTALPPFWLARYADSESGVLAAFAATGRDVVDVVGETRGILAARLLPIPSDAVSYAAGLTEVSVGAFVLGTLAGELPWVLAAVFAGDSMRQLTLSGASLGPSAVVAIASLGVLVLAGPLYSRLRGRPSPD